MTQKKDLLEKKNIKKDVGIKRELSQKNKQKSANDTLNQINKSVR